MFIKPEKKKGEENYKKFNNFVQDAFNNPFVNIYQISMVFQAPRIQR